MGRRWADDRESSGISDSPRNRLRLPWWNHGAIAKLRDHFEDLGSSPEDLTKSARVNPKTIRNWLNGHRVPTLSLLSRVCQHLALKVDDLRAAGLAHAAMVGRVTAFSHPHAALSAQIIQEINASPTSKLEFLAPPCFLKTRVLDEVSELLKETHTCVNVHAPTIEDFRQFWQSLMERFKSRQVEMPAFTDAYDSLTEGMRGHRCVLLLSGADRWIAQAGTAPGTWLSRLTGLPCAVVIAGSISIAETVSLGGWPVSGDFIKAVPAALNDGWEEWSHAIRRLSKVDVDDASQTIEKLAVRQPAAYVAGIEALAGGDLGHARQVIAVHHHQIGRLILDRLPGGLRERLATDAGVGLSPASREAKALARGGILVNERGHMRPAVDEWRSAWLDSGASAP